jgi:hypothetical protein
VCPLALEGRIWNPEWKNDQKKGKWKKWKK